MKLYCQMYSGTASYGTLDMACLYRGLSKDKKERRRAQSPPVRPNQMLIRAASATKMRNPLTMTSNAGWICRA